MLNNFKKWYMQNDVEITWTVIGALSAFGISDFAQGFYVSGVISLLFAYLNYAFRPIR
jgi:hypothetical protein